ncbi:SIMPL domain-containing protein [Lysobacter sp. GX 14042]|uniref:SIMPL domain-containing protein n=1 Tax=Lysobacter sp. GX 14042 TaxID=2907155 RepID=UPI001F21E1CB|nr:SIMPL domain-containing protein [Lysobacter sp. GX 14042]MCE7033145.1 SIMPL domain-containing protein [Lysobacter sp. GX 14042]
MSHTTRLRLPPLLLALGLATAATAVATAHAQVPMVPASNDGTLLTIAASADARRVPDIATLSAGVISQAADAQAAMRANAGQMDGVMATLRKAGIAERDIRTTGVNLHPQYRHSEDSAPQITGYQANNTVEVTVRDIAKIGPTMDALVASGANHVNGPSFSIDRPAEARDEARRAALEDARARARMYAETLGLRVRRIVSISEGAPGGPAHPMGMARMEMASADTAISPGENVVTANLEIVFELGR